MLNNFYKMDEMMGYSSRFPRGMGFNVLAAHGIILITQSHPILLILPLRASSSHSAPQQSSHEAFVACGSLLPREYLSLRAAATQCWLLCAGTSQYP